MSKFTKEDARAIILNYPSPFITAASYFTDGSHICYSTDRETFLKLIDEADVVALTNPDYPNLKYDFCAYAIGIWMFVGVKEVTPHE